MQQYHNRKHRNNTNSNLYSCGKELIWDNEAEYKDIVLMMGDLHILFNFLKAIGQHMENSDLDDVWVKSGLFAENSTCSMMQGKANYRAVRAHVWTYDLYEALQRICWKQFLE